MRSGLGLFGGSNRRRTGGVIGRMYGASPTYYPADQSGALQRTLVAGSSHLSSSISYHHPLMCSGSLAYEDDGTSACPHTKVDGDDPRTLAAITHSITLLIMEIAGETL